MNFDVTPHLASLRRRFEELESALGAPDLYDDPVRAQELIREHKRLQAALTDGERLSAFDRQIAEARAMLADAGGDGVAELAAEELPVLEAARAAAHQRVLAAIVPPDPNASRNTILEIRAGTGGDEAGLFAGDLFRMYCRHAERQEWKIEVLDANPAELGGYREITAMVTGEDVFNALRFESGVHRVQRVPATESQGRIHTSTATVAVLPEAREVDIDIRPDDLRIEVCRAGGPGGQGVNTTDSAVQVLHIPSGMIVRCQDERSQLKNKEKALNLLRARLLEKKQAEENAQYAAARKAQVGSGDRNEKIRTYNFPQNRVTDHRIQFTLHNLPAVMDGDLDELLAQLHSADVALKLEQLG